MQEKRKVHQKITVQLKIYAQSSPIQRIPLPDKHVEQAVEPSVHPKPVNVNQNMQYRG